VNRHTHTPAVVAELDDVVLVAVPLRRHDEAEQRLLLPAPVDLHAAAEEPVAAVLAGDRRRRGKEGMINDKHRVA